MPAINQPELELLLWCARPQFNQAEREQVRSLIKGINWKHLFLYGRRHGVIPLIYLRLQDAAADLVPANELECLKKYFQENSARNVLLAAELSNLIELLDGAQIEAIPYKGPALALFAYKDLALRRFVDLDIMVRKHDIPKAIELLLAQGYELSKPLNDGQQQIILKTQHNLQLRRYNRQLIVELHWEVASHLFASSVQADDLWQRLTTIDLGGRTMKTLAAEDLIFSLCIHGSRHLWDGLLWVCDVAWIIKHHSLDWPELLERARTTHTERMFLLGLHLCSKLFGVELPDSINQQITADHHRIDRLSEVVLTRLKEGPEYQPASTSRIFKYNFWVRKSWPSRARYFRHMLRPTDRDLEAFVLPRPLYFGYYLMRPIRLLFKAGEDAH